MKRNKYLAPAVAACALVFGAGMAQAATVCKPRMTGQGTGMGIAGQGSALARNNALTDWSNKVAARHGRTFSNSSRARAVRYDCRSGAILEAKCVVTALPCGEVTAKKKRKTTKRRR